LLRLDEAACNTLISAAAKQAYDWRLREKVGQELIQNQGPGLLTTGDATMDELFGQGIPLETITEIVGER
jgi:RecA/RadA recombinase